MLASHVADTLLLPCSGGRRLRAFAVAEHGTDALFCFNCYAWAKAYSIRGWMLV